MLSASGAVTAFATQYLASNPKIPDDFHVSPSVLDDFKVFLSARSIQPGVSEWTGERSWLINHLELEIVTQAKGVAKGDEVEANFNPQIQAAVKALRSGSVLAKAEK